MALCEYTDSWGSGPGRAAGYGRALQDARRAIALAPTLGEAHLALARVFESSLDFKHAGGKRVVMDGINEFREHLGGELTLTMLRRLGRGVEVHELDEGAMTYAIDRLREIG